MREKVVILITAMAVFVLLYFIKLQARSGEGKKCSCFFLGTFFFLYTRKCFIARNKKKVVSFHYRNFNFLRNKSCHFYHFKSKLKERL